MQCFDTIGIDLVAMCVNDVLCVGAEPLAFLDYIACNKIDVPNVVQIVKGISEGCKQANCTLIGGETAEMPLVYDKGTYDLAGYSVGVVENKLILPRISEVVPGDIIIGFASDGVHSNGFSVINKLIEDGNLCLSDVAPFGNGKESYGKLILSIYI